MIIDFVEFEVAVRMNRTFYSGATQDELHEIRKRIIKGLEAAAKKLSTDEYTVSIEEGE